MTDDLVKLLKVIADGHGEGEEFFEGFLGGGELYGNAAGGESDAGREIGKNLIHDRSGGFDGNAGLPGRAEFFEGPGEPLAALAFLRSDLAGGELLQVSDQPAAVGEAAGADLERDAGGEDLLGAAAADAEEALEGGAVDPRVGQGRELGQNGI
jgi:hypothetical protein